MTPDTIRNIIRVSLQPLTASRHPLYSQEAETILLMAAAHESRLGQYLEQIGGGPARGIWQVEIATMEDNYLTFLNYRPVLLSQILGVTRVYGANPLALKYNHRYNCIHARLKLYRCPGPLPVDNLWAMAEYLTEYYNAGGAATPLKYFDAYRELVAI